MTPLELVNFSFLWITYVGEVDLRRTLNITFYGISHILKAIVV